jgi:hypothetical protein
MRSDIVMFAKTETGRGGGLERGEYRPGNMLDSTPGTSGIKWNFKASFSNPILVFVFQSLFDFHIQA